MEFASETQLNVIHPAKYIHNHILMINLMYFFLFLFFLIKLPPNYVASFSYSALQEWATLDQDGACAVEQGHQFHTWRTTRACHLKNWFFFLQISILLSWSKKSRMQTDQHREYTTWKTVNLFYACPEHSGNYSLYLVSCPLNSERLWRNWINTVAGSLYRAEEVLW